MDLLFIANALQKPPLKGATYYWRTCAIPTIHPAAMLVLVLLALGLGSVEVVGELVACAIASIEH
jgi:hypothetical protein